MEKMIIVLVIAVLAMAYFSASPAQAQAEPTSGVLVPMGGGYSDLYPGLVQTILARARGPVVEIIVLPTSYSTNPHAITQAEYDLNMADAERRRLEIEGACSRAAPTGVTCKATIAPIFVRDDAQNPEKAALFHDEITAVFMLGGDQGVAMEVMVDTLIEARLADLFSKGLVFSGTSAGCGVQSAVMIADYSPNYARSVGLNFGAANIWNTNALRGLSFGVQEAIIDQHFFQRGRMPRLLEAVARPDTPGVGVGVDAYTGIHVVDGVRLEKVFGLYSVAVVDMETYQADDGVGYVGPNHLLRLRNVLVHLLAAGDFSYDIPSRTHSLAAPPAEVSRSFPGVALPAGAGLLVMGGGHEKFDASVPAFAAFLAARKGDGPVWVVVGGYANDAAAQRSADRLAGGLGVPAQGITLSALAQDPTALESGTEASGVLLVIRDASLVDSSDVMGIKNSWLGGLPVFADSAAVSVLGQVYAAYGPEPVDDADLSELVTQKLFRENTADLRPGAAFLPITFEPRVLDDNRWARLFALAYTHPELLAVGISSDTAIVFGSEDPRIVGLNGVVVLDFGQASRDVGENDAFVVANGLLDVFTPGDVLKPENASQSARPERQPTPVLTSVPTPASTRPAPDPTAPAEPPEGRSRMDTGSALGLLVAGGAAALGAIAWWFTRKRGLAGQ